MEASLDMPYVLITDKNVLTVFVAQFTTTTTTTTTTDRCDGSFAGCTDPPPTTLGIRRFRLPPASVLAVVLLAQSQAAPLGP